MRFFFLLSTFVASLVLADASLAFSQSNSVYSRYSRHGFSTPPLTDETFVPVPQESSDLPTQENDGFTLRSPQTDNYLSVPGIGQLQRGHKLRFGSWENFVPDKYEYNNDEKRLLAYLRSRDRQPCLTTRTNNFFHYGGSGWVQANPFWLDYYRKKEQEDPHAKSVENYSYVAPRDADEKTYFYSTDWRYIKEPIGLTAEWNRVFWTAAHKAWYQGRIRRAYNQRIEDQKKREQNITNDGEFLQVGFDAGGDVSKLQTEAEIDAELARWFSTKVGK